MAQSSIHIEQGKLGYVYHNSRENHTENSIFTDEENYCSADAKTAIKTYREELRKRSGAYTARTGRKLPSNTATHLSAIVNLNQNHTEQDAKKVVEYLEKNFDTKVFQYSIHRDEGHIDENGKQIKNYHMHIEFLGLDSRGQSIKRRLKKKELIQLQTDIANILGMERGINYAKERKKRPKRLDTYEFKEHKKQEEKAVRAKVKDLKAEIKQLRAELKEAHALRPQYAKLEQINRELKERIKQKELTEQQLKDEIEQLRQRLFQELQFEQELLEQLEAERQRRQETERRLETEKADKDAIQLMLDNAIDEEEFATEAKQVAERRLETEREKYIQSMQNIHTKYAQQLEQERQNAERQLKQLSSTISELKQQNAELLQTVKQLQEQLQQQPQTLEQKIFDTLDLIDDLLSKIRVKKDQANDIIESDDIADMFIEDAEQKLEELNEIEKAIYKERDKLDDADSDDIVSQVLQYIRQKSERIEEIAEKIDDLYELVDDETPYNVDVIDNEDAEVLDFNKIIQIKKARKLPKNQPEQQQVQEQQVQRQKSSNLRKF